MHIFIEISGISPLAQNICHFAHTGNRLDVMNADNGTAGQHAGYARRAGSFHPFCYRQIQNPADKSFAARAKQHRIRQRCKVR